jgi:cyclophilin family peptidyl-prolyl cis-trans isomerase
MNGVRNWVSPFGEDFESVASTSAKPRESGFPRISTAIAFFALPADDTPYIKEDHSMFEPARWRLGAPQTGSRLRLTIAIITAVLVGCGASSTTEPAATVGAKKPAAAQPSESDPLHPTVRIATSAGEIVVKLDAERAPGTVRNFLDYVNEGFYSDTLIHFVDPGKMILGGGYSSDGELKPTRLSILNEAHNGLKNMRGTIAMARSPETTDGATTQFFINIADAPQLDHVEGKPENYGYCVFGNVVEGLDVAEQISKTPTQNRGGDLFQAPSTAIVIKSINVVM